MRIHQVVLDANLVCMQEGLLQLCKKLKINTKDRTHGELIIFVNRKRNYIKCMAFGSEKPVVASVKRGKGMRFDMNLIEEIPRAFMYSGELDIDLALRRALNKKLKSQAF